MLLIAFYGRFVATLDVDDAIAVDSERHRDGMSGDWWWPARIFDADGMESSARFNVEATHPRLQLSGSAFPRGIGDDALEGLTRGLEDQARVALVEAERTRDWSAHSVLEDLLAYRRCGECAGRATNCNCAGVALGAAQAAE